MITIYTTNSCASCRKAKKWLVDYNIPYREINVMNTKIDRNDIVRMLTNAENGFEDIISKRSKVIMENNVDIDSMSFNELVDYIIDNPSILKRPIIIDSDKIQIGYNVDDIRIFIPSEIRKRFMCMNCTDCDYQRKLEEYMKELKKEGK